MNLQQINQGGPGTREFLDALFSRYFKAQDGCIEIRLIGKDNGVVEPLFFRPEELNDEIIKDVHELNLTLHVYVGVNPVHSAEGKKKLILRT